MTTEAGGGPESSVDTGVDADWVAKTDVLRAERDKYRAERARSRAERDAARDELERTRLELVQLRDARRSELMASAERIEARVDLIQRRQYLMPRELLTDMQAMYQLLHRYAPEATLPSVSGWALSPTGLLALTDIVVNTSAKVVVECGSGTSTLWIAYALRSLGAGKVIALDHLAKYAERTRQLIRLHGLEEFAEVREAPLTTRDTPRGEYRWYDIDPATFANDIDVLVVDGPPQSTGKNARYPAFPLLSENLSPGAWIVADDTDRPDEQEILAIWKADDERLRDAGSPGPGLAVLRFDSAL